MMGSSRMGEDPGWNPGLNETEALEGPGRFFYCFCFFMVLIVAGMIGYMLTYGSFGTDPPTPFGVGGLNSQSDAKYDPAHRWRG